MPQPRKRRPDRRTPKSHRYISLAHALFLSLFAEPFGVAGVFPDSPRCCSSLPTTNFEENVARFDALAQALELCRSQLLRAVGNVQKHALEFIEHTSQSGVALF